MHENDGLGRTVRLESRSQPLHRKFILLSQDPEWPNLTDQTAAAVMMAEVFFYVCASNPLQFSLYLVVSHILISP